MIQWYARFKFYLHFFVTLFFLIGAPLAFAQTGTVTVTAQSVLENVSAQIPNLMRMVTALSYVIGLYLIVFAILKLKQYGESRTQMSHDRSLTGTMVFFFVGALMVYLPNTVQSGLSTFFTDPNPYGYLQSAGQWSSVFSDIFLIVQFFGTVALVRGLVILSKLGNHGDKTLATGLTHVIGGILCINIYQVVQIIFATLGISVTT